MLQPIWIWSHSTVHICNCTPKDRYQSPRSPNQTWTRAKFVALTITSSLKVLVKKTSPTWISCSNHVQREFHRLTCHLTPMLIKCPWNLTFSKSYSHKVELTCCESAWIASTANATDNTGFAKTTITNTLFLAKPTSRNCTASNKKLQLRIRRFYLYR